jgi:hypothetical protein
MEHKDAMERTFNTEAHRHRNIEAQGEEVNITLKKFNRIARMVRINRIVVF